MNDSLNDLVLNDQLLVSLYAKVLVGADVGQAALNVSKPATTLKFLGNNHQKITILVSDSDHRFLAEEALAFLTKILMACRLNIADVAIVNICSQPGWHDNLQELRPEKVISFGVAHPQKEIPLFSITPWQDILWMVVPPLSAFINGSDQEIAHKTSLWLCLQKLFQISGTA